MKSFLLTAFLFCTMAALKAQSSEQMSNNQQDQAAIKQALENNYFKGIYEGDINLLKQVYYKDVLMFGDVQGAPYFRTLDQYLDGVKTRKSPKDSGKPFKPEIISIKLINSIAVAELKVKMYDFNYHEFLSFHKLDGKWLIVNKMISDVNE